MIPFPGKVFRHVFLLVALVSPMLAAGAPAPHVTISVDATEAPRKIFHTRMTIPTKPGSLTLYYPKWIPGEHGPTGPVQDLAGLKFSAGGKSLAWRRDLLDGWTFHVEVPAGVSSVEASLDFISPNALFGAQHYRDYHFLYSLSDHVAHFGLEHHESNDSRLGERALVDPTKRLLGSGLLSHEFVHSWNGKYRRPADLATPDYEKPMQTDLLWVYEGLTQYLGEILTGRMGERTPEEFRDSLAYTAAYLDHTPGRAWRNLQDTADGVPAMQDAPHQWESWRRALDYYDEDELTWLWADTLIRQQTHGQKSMDDFCRIFHGPPSGPPQVKTYTFDDIVNTLNQIAPYDWRGFWTERLTNHGPGAPLGGIEAGGWKLVYDDTRSPLVQAEEGYSDSVNAAYSIGLWLKKEDGLVTDTVEGMPAARAGIGPGMKLVAVNGRKFSKEVLGDALRAGKNSSAPLELLVENTEYYKTYKLDYHDGEKFPHLVRDETKPDLLSDIIKPH